MHRFQSCIIATFSFSLNIIISGLGTNFLKHLGDHISLKVYSIQKSGNQKKFLILGKKKTRYEKISSYFKPVGLTWFMAGRRRTLSRLDWSIMRSCAIGKTNLNVLGFFSSWQEQTRQEQTMSLQEYIRKALSKHWRSMLLKNLFQFMLSKK